MNTGYGVEVPVAAQQWKAVLSAESGNPEVICWNRVPRLLELDADGRIVMRSLLADFQHRAIGDQTIQPSPVPGPVPGLGDPEAILPNNYNGERYLLCASQNLQDPRMFLCGSGKGVGV